MEEHQSISLIVSVSKLLGKYVETGNKWNHCNDGFSQSYMF